MIPLCYKHKVWIASCDDCRVAHKWLADNMPANRTKVVVATSRDLSHA